MVWVNNRSSFDKRRITKFVAFVYKSKGKQLSQTSKINITTNEAIPVSVEKNTIGVCNGERKDSCRRQ